MMDRRGFLSSCLALAAAPAIVRADSLMRVVARGALIVPASNEDVIRLLRLRIDNTMYEIARQLVQKVYTNEGEIVAEWAWREAPLGIIDLSASVYKHTTVSSPAAAVRVDEARAAGSPPLLGWGGSFLP